MIRPIPVQIRFSDVDSMGHVNNAVYLNYFETARMHFFHEFLGDNWDWIENGVILLRNEVDYHRPLLLTDKALAIVGVDKIGEKSFVLSYSISVDNVVYCSGKSTLVSYDYTQRKSKVITDKMKVVLERVFEEQDL